MYIICGKPARKSSTDGGVTSARKHRLRHNVKNSTCELWHRTNRIRGLVSERNRSEIRTCLTRPQTPPSITIFSTTRQEAQPIDHRRPKIAPRTETPNADTSLRLADYNSLPFVSGKCVQNVDGGSGSHENAVVVNGLLGVVEKSKVCFSYIIRLA